MFILHIFPMGSRWELLKVFQPSDSLAKHHQKIGGIGTIPSPGGGIYVIAQMFGCLPGANIFRDDPSFPTKLWKDS